MDQKETLALWKSGKEAWNTWAQKMLNDRSELQKSGDWETTTDYPQGTEVAANEITANWFDEARGIFSSPEAPTKFNKNTSFAGFIFPALTDWQEAAFEGEICFDNAVFEGETFFSLSIFGGNVWFKDVKFKGKAQFDRVMFLREVSFTRSTFKRKADFTDSSFHGKQTDFDRITFEGDALFIYTLFIGQAWFDNTTFESVTSFTQTRFYGDVWFSDAKFSPSTNLPRLAFEPTISFSRVLFEGDAGFSEATFDGETWFDNATFEAGAAFDGAIFARSIRFTKVNFFSNSSFNSAQISKAFDMSGAMFSQPPDFRQSHFEEAPLLDGVYFQNRSRHEHFLSRKQDSHVTANYRALKRLAIQGHDHGYEIEFFAEELRAKRIMVDKLFSLDWFLSAVFAVTSDYGRSVIRPILWWIPLTYLSCLSYLSAATIKNAPQTLFDAGLHIAAPAFHSLQSFIPVRFNISWIPEASQLPTLQCSGGTVTSAAFHLAISKGLIVPGFVDKTLTTQAYSCLYNGTPSFSIFATIGTQTLLSAALLFLFLLGIRNRFKLK
ncbi:pentapeptide repeat-containing protein [Thalassospira sp. UBA1131]|uniref:pentapeptide repeat-containing protein n=1 Tax=Thalassospira sp. UBA1131 TaxID=1947672 RepID=UPI0025F0D7D6|nr:pentapeptide repeat-containing protein [Thalassospira sp. UBA1131]